MKFLSVIVALIALIAVMSAPIANAESQASNERPNDAAQARAQDITDRAGTERGKEKRPDKKKMDKVADKLDKGSSDDANYEAGKRRDMSHDASDRDEPANGLDNAATRGNEQSQEMRARRDEGKTIKDEYKAREKSGNSELDRVTSEEGEKKDKKPWWKFWGE